MSDLVPGRPAAAGGAFGVRTIALMLAVGIVGFVGMLVLGAYAPDLQSGQNGGAHALSKAATGYSGLVRLAEATGRHPRIVRSEGDFSTEDLLILTPEFGSTNISKALAGRVGKPTLFVLPKWVTTRDPDNRAWVRMVDLKNVQDPQGVLNPAYKLTIARYRSGGRPLITGRDLPADIAFTAPRPIQVITHYVHDDRVAWGEEGIDRSAITPLITDGKGGIVVAQIGGGPFYILADPDLLSNRGMRSERQARSALALLDWMNSTGADGMAFDVSFNGLGHSPSPLKLAFEPPFLAMTLAIVAALILVGIHAFGRFGPLQKRERAIAFGKAALVNNSAAMVSKAKRESRLGGRYVDVIRDRAVYAFGISPRLRGAALDAHLDGLRGRATFTDLAQAAQDASSRQELIEAARALHAWQGEKIR